MRNAFAFVLFVLLLGAVYGCKDDQTDSGNVLTIDSPLQLTIVETLGAGRTLSVHAATERVYGCANYTLVATPSTTDSTYTISFDNVNGPSVCSPGNLPARVDVALGSLRAGHYTLALKVNSSTINAALTVTDTSFAVANGEGRWTTFTRTYTHKVPQNCIWGNMQSNDPNASTAFRSFNDSLVATGAVARLYPTAEYGFFKIDATGAVVAPSSSYLFVKTFIYQYSGDMIVIRELMKRFGASHRGQLDIFLYGSRGESYQASVLGSGS